MSSLEKSYIALMSVLDTLVSPLLKKRHDPTSGSNYTKLLKENVVVSVK
jgi:hypothetical protein